MSSSSHYPWIYDVFVSFRGEDTRRNFVSHLYAALTNAGIRTFLDEEGLRKSEELGAGLRRAIEGSRISIVVFSENYAGSSWCLKELVHIMECQKDIGQVVLPVFYDVYPSYVRKIFAFPSKRNKKDKEDMLSRWSKALSQVANLSGWDAKNSR